MMNLSGTCWGELPATELNIPDFLQQPVCDCRMWDIHYNDARIQEAVGRERRKARIRRKSVRCNLVSGIGFAVIVVSLMIVSVMFA